MLSKLILAGVLAVAVASAQRGGMGGMGGDTGGGMGGGDRGGGMNGGGMMGNRPSSRMELFSDMLNLNKDQKKQVKSIMDEGQKDAVPVKEEMTKSRLALAEAATSGKTGDDLKPLETHYAEAEAKMHQIELNSFAKIYLLLDKDQQAKAGQLFVMMSGVFHGKYWTEMN